MKVLVADDEAVTRVKLDTLLTGLGYEVVLACDGAEAWDILQRPDAPSLAILDWLMPGMDGLEVCRNVRDADTSHGYVYLIMLTIKDQKADFILGMESGVDDYMSKPFDLDELRVRLRAGERMLEYHEALRAHCSHDQLTGVLSRAAILDLARRELLQVSRQGTAASIAVADLDQFKAINDAYGHPVGDEVLREACRRLSSGLRATDAIGRYGGEEFLVVLADCGPVLALEAADRIRSLVGTSPIQTKAGPISVTVSLGVASAEGVSRNIDDLILAADAAMYDAKRAGRNRVIAAGAI